METVYQVQIRRETVKGGRFDDWTSCNAGNDFDILETIDDAQILLDRIKKKNDDLNKKFHGNNPVFVYEYRIVKICYETEIVN